MIVALIDNGSVEVAAHRNLRAVAAALSARSGVTVHAVSWKHSDWISPEALDQAPAWIVASFVRAFLALGEREFVFIPFFISAQGAIGSALRRDLETLQRELGGFSFAFTEGLAARGVIPEIVADRIRETIASSIPAQTAPRVIVVDHGGPSPASAALRDEIAANVRSELGAAIGPLVAASMEGAHPPLLADQLGDPAYADRDVIVARLFLSAGRHAGAQGDVARICAAARSRCHLTGLVGTHPRVIDVLAAALQSTLSTLHAPAFA